MIREKEQRAENDMQTHMQGRWCLESEGICGGELQGVVSISDLGRDF